MRGQVLPEISLLWASGHPPPLRDGFVVRIDASAFCFPCLRSTENLWWFMRVGELAERLLPPAFYPSSRTGRDETHLKVSSDTQLKIA